MWFVLLLASLLTLCGLCVALTLAVTAPIRVRDRGDCRPDIRDHPTGEFQ